MSRMRVAVLAVLPVVLGVPSLHSEASAPQAEVVRVTRELFAAMGNVDRFMRYFDRGSDYSHFERGRLMDWSEHEPDIRAFFTNAKRIQAGWEDAPKVVIVGDAAVVAGLSRFEFTFADGKASQNRAATTMVLRRGKAGWKVIHDHFSAAADPASK